MEGAWADPSIFFGLGTSNGVPIIFKLEWVEQRIALKGRLSQFSTVLRKQPGCIGEILMELFQYQDFLATR